MSGDDPNARAPKYPEGFIHFGGSVDETSAMLRIHGDDLDPDEITKLLKFPPTCARRKDDVKIGKKTKREYRAQTGMWHLESPSGQGDLNKHTQWLLDVLEKKQEVWDLIKSRYSLDLFCGLFLNDWNRGTVLSAEMMSELGRRGIDLELDIYSHSPDDQEG